MSDSSLHRFDDEEVTVAAETSQAGGNKDGKESVPGPVTQQQMANLSQHTESEGKLDDKEQSRKRSRHHLAKEKEFDETGEKNPGSPQAKKSRITPSNENAGVKPLSDAKGDEVVAGPSSALETVTGSSVASHHLQKPNHSSVDLQEEMRSVLRCVNSFHPEAVVPAWDLVRLFEKHSAKPDRSMVVFNELLSIISKDELSTKVEKPQDIEKSLVEEEVQAEPPPPARGDSVQNDPIYRDVQVLAAMFPNRDQNELYAYLEVHHNREDRLNRVIDELLDTADDTVPEQNAGSETKPEDPQKKLSPQDELTLLQDMFPECDPDFLEKRLRAKKGDPHRAHAIATEMSNGKPYPKLQDKLARERKEAEKRRLWNLDMTPEAFLEKFPDPVETFNNLKKTRGDLYKEHCKVKLHNEFPFMSRRYIRHVLEDFTYHLTPAWEVLQKTPTNRGMYECMNNCL